MFKSVQQADLNIACHDKFTTCQFDFLQAVLLLLLAETPIPANMGVSGVVQSQCGAPLVFVRSVCSHCCASVVQLTTVPERKCAEAAINGATSL